MKIYALQSNLGYYKSRNKWVPLDCASVWTNKNGPNAVKGRLGSPKLNKQSLKVVDFEVKL